MSISRSGQTYHVYVGVLAIACVLCACTENGVVRIYVYIARFSMHASAQGESVKLTLQSQAQRQIQDADPDHFGRASHTRRAHGLRLRLFIPHRGACAAASGDEQLDVRGWSKVSELCLTVPKRPRMFGNLNSICRWYAADSKVTKYKEQTVSRNPRF